MNELELRMLNLLKDLKQNHGVIALKAEFEDEGSTFNEVLRLKELSKLAELELTVKLGGCSALNDMHEAKRIGVSSVVAPMVESPYSAKKFLNNVHKIFKDNTKFYINIETKYALNFINEILEQDFTGIILGRSDLTNSLGLLSSEVNNERILNIAKEVSLLAGKTGKTFSIGGGVNALSIPFFKSLPYLTAFETRKVIFNTETALNDRIKEGILKAADFELMWIKNNKDNYNEFTQEDKTRIETLKSRFSV